MADRRATGTKLMAGAMGGTIVRAGALGIWGRVFADLETLLAVQWEGLSRAREAYARDLPLRVTLGLPQKVTEKVWFGRGVVFPLLLFCVHLGLVQSWI